MKQCKKVEKWRGKLKPNEKMKKTEKNAKKMRQTWKKG